MKAIATAAAEIPIAATAPYAASHRTPPPSASTLMNGAEISSAIAVMVKAIAAMRIEKTFGSATGDDISRSRSARE